MQGLNTNQKMTTSKFEDWIWGIKDERRETINIYSGMTILIEKQMDYGESIRESDDSRNIWGILSQSLTMFYVQ